MTSTDNVRDVVLSMLEDNINQKEHEIELQKIELRLLKEDTAFSNLIVKEFFDYASRELLK